MQIGDVVGVPIGSNVYMGVVLSIDFEKNYPIKVRLKYIEEHTHVNYSCNFRDIINYDNI